MSERANEAQAIRKELLDLAERVGRLGDEGATSVAPFSLSEDIQELSPGRRLMFARNQAGLSQDKLAKQAGVNVNTVINFENGKTQPRMRTLMALARGVGIDWNLLSEGEDDG